MRMINLMCAMFRLQKHLILSSEYNTNIHKVEMTQANVSWWNFYHHKWGIFITHSWPKNILLSVSRFVYTNLYFGSIVTETFMCFSFRICCGNFFFFRDISILLILSKANWRLEIFSLSISTSATSLFFYLVWMK